MIVYFSSLVLSCDGTWRKLDRCLVPGRFLLDTSLALSLSLSVPLPAFIFILAGGGRREAEGSMALPLYLPEKQVCHSLALRPSLVTLLWEPPHFTRTLYTCTDLLFVSQFSEPTTDDEEQ